MDNSTCSFTNQSSLQTAAQRKFYQWVLKWIHGIHAHADRESNIEESRDVRNPTKPDIPTLASLLQAIGFKLISFEKHNDAQKKDENDISMLEPGVLRVAIECGSSNMRAILELGEITCRCPNSDHVKDASFWSISGTGPTGSTDNIVQKVEETGSNLLPRLSKDVTRVLRDVSYRLFETIVSEPDVNRNTDTSLNVSRSSNTSSEPKATQENSRKEIGVVRSYTQPEMRFRTNSLISKCFSENRAKIANDSQASVSRDASVTDPSMPTLQRQKTWDIDIETASLDGEPRTSPPKVTSSPTVVVDLSNSLGQISLEGEIENPGSLTEYIIGAKQNLEKVLKMLLSKKPIIDLSPNPDHDSASIKSAPANISPAAIVSPYKPTRSNTINSVKPLPKLNHLTYQQQSLTKLNSGIVAQPPKARRSIEPTLSKSFTRRSLQIEQENSRPVIRRNSFYIPSPASSKLSLLSKPSDVGQRLLGSGKYNTTKTNITPESDFSNRSYISARKISTPEARIDVSQNLETLNTPNGRTTSIIKTPSKISKAIPVKIKPVQPSKISTGVVKKSRTSLSKE